MILLNGKQIIITQFPNGESDIKVDDLELKKNNIIIMKYEDDSDLIHLMIIKSYLDEKDLECKLFLGYIPYSRMDKPEGIHLFTLKYLCNFINSLHFTSVMVIEPHSDVAPALLNKCKVVHMSTILAKRIIKEKEFDKEKDVIYFPNARAEKNFGKEMREMGFRTLTGVNQRDFGTGDIIGIQLIGNIPSDESFKVIIIDDLCSYGGDFLRGAQKLIEIGAGDIYLSVSHCEHSIFLGGIFQSDLIKEVYTTNTMIQNQENQRLIVLNLEECI